MKIMLAVDTQDLGLVARAGLARIARYLRTVGRWSLYALAAWIGFVIVWNILIWELVAYGYLPPGTRP